MLRSMLELSPDSAESNNRSLSGLDLPDFEDIIGGSAAQLQVPVTSTGTLNSQLFYRDGYNDDLIRKLINGLLDYAGTFDKRLSHR